MKNRNRSYACKERLPRLWLAFLAVPALLATLPAQDVEDGELFELSPFVVTSEEVVGYQAATSLAGNRIKTDVRDIGAALSIVTSEFLDDTGSDDIQDLFTLTTSTEVAGASGNVAFGDPRRPQNAFRLRGIGNAELAVDYIQTDIPFDSYNTERVEIIRGANSVLSGIGSPAGFVTNNTISPMFDNVHKVEFKIDNYGTSRVSFDLNREVIEDMLAIRVAGLREDLQYRQDPAFEEDTRIFAAGTFRQNWGSDSTGPLTFKVKYEDGEIDSRQPEPVGPGDFITMWANFATNGVTKPWNAVGREGSDGNPVLLGPASGDFAPIRPPDIFEQSIAVSGTDGSAIDYAFVQRLFPTRIDTDGDGELQGLRDFHAGANLNFTPGRRGFFSEQGLLDTRLYDFENNLLSGSANLNQIEFDRLNLTIEQTYFDQNLGFEISYDDQSYRDDSNYSVRNRLYIDATEVLPTGQANPNYGRPFVTAAAIRRFLGVDDKETLRATAFYNLDFRELLDNKAGPVLGEHTLTLYYNDQTWDTGNETLGLFVTSPDVDFGTTRAPRAATIPGSRRLLARAIYVGPSLADIGSVANAPTQSGGPSSTLYTPDISISPAYIWAANDAGNTSAPPISSRLEVSEAVQESAFIDRAKLESKVAILQSSFLDGSIVTLFGWREDEVTSSSFDFAEGAFVSGEADSAEPVTASITGHLPEDWIPAGIQLSIHYAQSENFDPGFARIDVLGNPISSPGGETTEYGFTLGSKDGRFSAKFNWFETNQAHDNFGVDTILAIANTFEYQSLNFFDDGIDAGAPSPREFDPDSEFTTWVEVSSAWLASIPAFNREMFQAENSTGEWLTTVPSALQGTEDLTAEGFELELAYNPTDNFRMLLNVAQVETVTDNRLNSLAEYIELRTPDWQRFFDLPRVPAIATVGGGDPMVGEIFLTNQLLPFNSAKFAEGEVVSQQAEWRANLIANYVFADADGFLKNIGFGGAVRWEDESAVGSPLIDVNNNNAPVTFPVASGTDTSGVVNDVTSPYLSGDRLGIDFWVNKVFSIGQSRTLKMQLNVRNAIGEDNVIAITAQPDGSVAQVRYPPPTVFELTGTFNF